MIFIPSLLVCEGRVIDPVDGHCLFADVREAVRALSDFGAEFFHLDVAPDERAEQVGSFADRGLPHECEARGDSIDAARELLRSGTDRVVLAADDELSQLPEAERFRSVVVVDSTTVSRAAWLVENGFGRLRIEGAPDASEPLLQTLLDLGAETSLGTEVLDREGFEALTALERIGLSSVVLYGAARRAQARYAEA